MSTINTTKPLQEIEIDKVKPEKQHDKKDSEQLINIKEVASMLDVSIQTIYRMVEGKEIPYIPIRGGRRKTTIRFRPSSIERWRTRKEVKINP